MSNKGPCKKRRKSSHRSSSSTAGQWLCAHPEAQKNIEKKLSSKVMPSPVIPKMPCLPFVPPPVVPKISSSCDLNVAWQGPQSDLLPNSNLFETEEIEDEESQSLYHPKLSYRKRKKVIKVVREVKEEEAACLKPPSPLVFTEDLLYSNYDWGLGDSPSGEFPPPTIQFSDEM